MEAGLQMSYNLCNLPKQITAEDGTLVNYTYFADGTKFKAVDDAIKYANDKGIEVIIHKM